MAENNPGKIGVNQSSYPAAQDKRTPPSTEIKASVFREREVVEATKAGKEDRNGQPWGGTRG